MRFGRLSRLSRLITVGTVIVNLLNLSPIAARAGDEEDRRPGSPIKHVVVIFHSASPSLGNQQGRCGYGPRLPLLVNSPFARKNYVDHNVADQSSILRFIEDNWSLGRIGGGSFDAIAGSLLSMFDFDEHRDDRVILDPSSGEIVRSGDAD